jgi:methylated-DNA-[protein]-cysteine S-methyltransferase
MSSTKQINIQYYKTNMGEFILGSFDSKLCMLDWRYRKMRTTIDNRMKNRLAAEYVENSDEVTNKTIAQLDEYLSGERNQFDIPLLMVGTDFQKSAWNALLQIPYGFTSSYLQLAESINNKKAVRAVANANGANAISLIIPCHRIIGSNGKLVGYAGGLPIKKRLLALEKSKHLVSTDYPISRGT